MFRQCQDVSSNSRVCDSVLKFPGSTLQNVSAISVRQAVLLHKQCSCRSRWSTDPTVSLTTAKVLVIQKILTAFESVKTFSYSRHPSSSKDKAIMAKTRMPMINPAACASNMARETRAAKNGAGVGRYKGVLRRCGSCAPAVVQAQHGLCLIPEDLSRTRVN